MRVPGIVVLVEMTRGRQDESRMNLGISPGTSRVYFFMMGRRDGLLAMKSDHSLIMFVLELWRERAMEEMWRRSPS